MSLIDKTAQMPDLLKTSEVADFLRVSHPTIKRWIRDGDMKAHQITPNGSYRIEKEELIKKIAP
jgi:excisionase family DNA binding protein